MFHLFVSIATVSVWRDPREEQRQVLWMIIGNHAISHVRSCLALTCNHTISEPTCRPTFEFISESIYHWIPPWPVVGWQRRVENILIKLSLLSYFRKAKIHLTFGQIQKDGSACPQASCGQSRWLVRTFCGRILHWETENQKCGSVSPNFWVQRGPK